MDFLHFKNCCIVFHRMHYEIVTPLAEIQGCFSLKKKKKERKKENYFIKYHKEQSCTCPLAHMWLCFSWVNAKKWDCWFK